jgi:hypothetical protein
MTFPKVTDFKELAKQDTIRIRKAINLEEGRPYSENRSYGRRVKFWCVCRCSKAEIERRTELLKAEFGNRFIECNLLRQERLTCFEVKLEGF